MPNPIRSSCRPAGSAGSAAPEAADPRGGQARTLSQASPSTVKISSAMRPWCSSAAWNAATTVGLSTLSPEFIPGTTSPALLAQFRLARRVLGRPARARGRPGAAAAPKRRSRTLLATTNAEDAAIAAPAMIGLRKPAAASGIATML